MKRPAFACSLLTLRHACRQRQRHLAVKRPPVTILDLAQPDAIVTSGINEGDEFVENVIQNFQRIALKRVTIDRLATHLSISGVAEAYPWDDLYRRADKKLSLEARELVVSLLIEGQSGIVDDLEGSYRVDEGEAFRINGSRVIADVLTLIDQNYRWVWKFDFYEPSETTRFWCTSKEKLEPRLGKRCQEDGASREQPLAIARDVQALRQALALWAPFEQLAAFLRSLPNLRHCSNLRSSISTLPHGRRRRRLGR